MRKQMLLLLVAGLTVAPIQAEDEPRVYTNEDLGEVEGNLTFSTTPAPSVSDPEPGEPAKVSSELKKMAAHYRRLRLRRDEIEESLPDLEEAADRETDAFWVIREGDRHRGAGDRLEKARAELEEVQRELDVLTRRARKLGVSEIGLSRS